METKYKAFTTRKMLVEHHYKMKLIAATLGMTIEDVFELVVEEGLKSVERVIGAGDAVERGQGEGGEG